MEHHWDEAYGYFDAPLTFTSPWNKDTDGALRFWNNYSNTVDAAYPGINQRIMEAYISGRTAVVNNDREGIDAARAALYENLELVAAGTAIHYINSSLAALTKAIQESSFTCFPRLGHSPMHLDITLTGNWNYQQ